MIGESQGREKTNPTKETRPPLPTDREGFRVRGEGDLDELERGTGGQGWFEIKTYTHNSRIHIFYKL